MTFREAYGRAPDVTESAPGRVNLLGEHTDYNDGFVLPVAIPQRTTAEVGRRADRSVRLRSADLPGDLRRALAHDATFVLGEEARRGGPIDYVAGVTYALAKAGHRLSGFDLHVSSEVPIGGGLSSSAALMVSILRALRRLFELPIDDLAIARLAHVAETELVGAPVGIMDQMASSLADDRAALFLDTRSRRSERVPIPEEVELVVIDSGIAHDHANGDYRVRRAECEKAAAILGVSSLRELAEVPTGLPDPLDRRVRHVVTENQRVLDGVAAMRANDRDRLGALFVASHRSMRDDYEVSTPEVDRLVEIACADPAIAGARLTGGGFGGAIVALARRGEGAAAGERICEAYGGSGKLLVRGRT
jgi:galactokinase